MKKSGSISEFIEQRDRELSAAFREILLTADMPLSRKCFAAAAKRPCSRFWVEGNHAPSGSSKEMIGGEHLDPDGIGNARQKREMYGEILHRVEGAATFRQRCRPGTEAVP